MQSLVLLFTDLTQQADGIGLLPACLGRWCTGLMADMETMEGVRAEKVKEALHPRCWHQGLSLMATMPCRAIFSMGNEFIPYDCS